MLARGQYLVRSAWCLVLSSCLARRVRGRNRTDLNHDPHHVRQTVFLDDLAVRDAIDAHAGHCEWPARWRHAHKDARVRPAHREACGYFVAFGDHILQGPLHVREATTQHAEESKVAIRPSERRHAGRMEHRAWSNQFCSERRTGRVDEFGRETTDDLR